MEIDQEVLCEYCKDKNEFPESFLCEGGACAESRESYLEEYGMTEEKTSFSQIKPGDVVYIIEGDCLAEMEVSGILLGRNSAEIHYNTNNTIELVASNSEYSRKDDLYHVFIDKKKAISKYESLMASKIITMAKNLAKF